MKGLLIFISYCEAYYDDCYLVKRCHLNLSLIIETFRNIINSSVIAKQKLVFNLQRMSMLPQGERYLDSNNQSSYSLDHLASKRPQKSFEGCGSSNTNHQDQYYIAPSEISNSENGFRRTNQTDGDEKIELARVFHQLESVVIQK